MLNIDVNLQPYNTFGLCVKAKKFVACNTVESIVHHIKANKKEKEALLVLGGGSNILLTQDFDGLVLKNDLKGITCLHQDADYAYVKAAAGEIWHEFVLFAIAQNWSGIENLSLIPGSVGAAPMQNIGAYGVEIKDVFHSLEALNLETLNVEEFTANDCQFGYRESVFKHALKGKYIILSVTLRLAKKHNLNTTYGAIEAQLSEMNISKPTLKDVSNAVVAIRQSKLPDPAKIGNSGSFFKNPVIGKTEFEALKKDFPSIAHYIVDDNNIKLAAGWLIEQAGWKGKTIGNYGVHKNQALVLVNYGGATGQEIYALSQDILDAVKKMFGVTLEREVNII